MPRLLLAQILNVAVRLGHTDPAFTLRVHAHMMSRSLEERERLRALVEEGVLSQIQPQNR